MRPRTDPLSTNGRGKVGIIRCPDVLVPTRQIAEQDSSVGESHERGSLGMDQRPSSIILAVALWAAPTRKSSGSAPRIGDFIQRRTGRRHLETRRRQPGRSGSVPGPRSSCRDKITIGEHANLR